MRLLTVHLTAPCTHTYWPILSGSSIPLSRPMQTSSLALLWMILWTTILASPVSAGSVDELASCVPIWHLQPVTNSCHVSVLATGFTERGYENYMKEAVSLDQFNDVRQEQQYAPPRESPPAPTPAPASYQQGPPSLDSPDKVPGFLKNLKKRR